MVDKSILILHVGRIYAVSVVEELSRQRWRDLFFQGYNERGVVDFYGRWRGSACGPSV